MRCSAVHSTGLIRSIVLRYLASLDRSSSLDIVTPRMHMPEILSAEFPEGMRSAHPQNSSAPQIVRTMLSLDLRSA